jgi:DNA-binding transcriptional regulator LsrR (DeoR family)
MFWLKRKGIQKTMNNRPDVRLITQVARLYYEERLTQTDIAGKLGMSQVSVCRFLKKAEDYNIVRTTVISPAGAFLDLEVLLERKFGLQQVLIAEASRDSEEPVLTAIGAAAAHFLETTVKSGEVIGISSWSASLLSMVEHLHPVWKIQKCKVVQMLGGFDSPSAEKHANHLTTGLATLVQGEPHFLPAPGIVGSASSVKILANDPYVRETMELFDRITLALIGIGSVEPSALVASSGNAYSTEELETIREKGGVGNICLRFYDARGMSIQEPLGDRVIGMDLERLRNVSRLVGIAGGKQKFQAILGALRGGWINILITDQYTAKRLTMN